MKKGRRYPSQDPMVKLRQDMKLRGFSQKTVKSYSHYITDCLKQSNKSAREINTNDICSYLEKMASRGCGSSTVNIAHCALKFYFEKVLNRRFFASIPKTKSRKRLPVVLSKVEIKRMIQLTTNPKHRFMLCLFYGTGIRLSELLYLKMKHIDFDRNLINIVRGKGGKDRYVLLPERIKVVLRVQNKIKSPDDFLFTNRKGGRLTGATVEKVVKQAADRANILKRVTPHTLRHTFATHMLESGTDIRFIQKLLGHARLETTQVYTHVASDYLNQLSSPLDTN